MAESRTSSIKEHIQSDISIDKSSNEKCEVIVREKSKWQDPGYFKNSFQEYLFVGSCMTTQLLNQATTPQTLSIMNVLSDSFNSSRSNQTWLVASFPLVAGSFILISGRIGDIYGLKKTLIGGYIFLIIWSLICGFTYYSKSDTFLIIARAFQGLGIAFTLPNVVGTIGNIYHVGSLRKNMVISLIAASAPVGAAIGGAFAGLIVTESPSQWPWSFYAFAIACSFNLLISIYSIPSNIPTNVNGFKMDWIGSALIVTGLILFNFAWNQGPIVGWDIAYIIVLLIISVIFILAFLTYEINFAPSPLIAREITHSRNMIITIFTLFLGWGSYGIWSFYYFSFVLNLRHYSPVWAGGSYFIFGIFGVLASAFVGISIKKITAPVILLFSMVLFCVGTTLLSVAPVDQSYFKLTLAGMAILGVGLDTSFPAATIILSDGLPMEYQGMAGSLALTMVNYSMSLCLGMGNTVERQINKDGQDVLKGYRSAEYLGIGLSGLGLLLACILVIDKLVAKYRNKNSIKNSA
ncbi:hypothetical protein KAFR_0A02840 [Kazachstania africana CBS 2517]|uniref:Major facilitator superfamily (MFS) profile domain-containing protein n=1 Tax=Kazachstania africana (strain ATCC 22294 / BCRC 22015 / CBS 2517 / CECT 1963 / NBRC 1671 / NRRL Y-8276) TaxID=1071382 RepID=H2AMX0_KAZAF|nr:hypothetical protein KAFR_0A02840 [Kazachstania africana CBS 2517]CCF55720.1 hypothetical protein KAFR_0A02840 [Kazachstania africana CBS 2517]